MPRKDHAGLAVEAFIPPPYLDAATILNAVAEQDSRCTQQGDEAAHKTGGSGFGFVVHVPKVAGGYGVVNSGFSVSSPVLHPCDMRP